MNIAASNQKPRQQIMAQNEENGEDEQGDHHGKGCYNSKRDNNGVET